MEHTETGPRTLVTGRAAALSLAVSRRDVSEQMSRDSDLAHLEGDTVAVTDGYGGERSRRVTPSPSRFASHTLPEATCSLGRLVHS